MFRDPRLARMGEFLGFQSVCAMLSRVRIRNRVPNQSFELWTYKQTAAIKAIEGYK